MLDRRRVVQRLGLDAVSVLGAFFLGWVLAFAAGGYQDELWDGYLATHGMKPPPPEYMEAHGISPYLMPSLLVGPIVLVLLLRLYLWQRACRFSRPPISTIT